MGRRRGLSVLGAGAWFGALVCVVIAGCSGVTNPSFDVSIAAANAELRSIPRRSVELERPVVVAAGFMDPGFGVSSLSTRLRRLVVDPEMVIEVPFFTTPSFELARERIVSKVEEAFPSGDPWNTVEVDVIGISMGGLVARFAAMPAASEGGDPADPEGSAGGEPAVKRLRIRTLFTLGTPHHGATRAMSTLAFDGRIEDMRSGSGFLESLNKCWCDRDYELVAYTRLGDDIVGCANALDPDGRGWWLDPPVLSFSHLQMQTDPRIVCDILRRIRGEVAWTMGEPAPLPE